MLYFTAVSTGTFIVIAIVANILGFGGIALGAAEIARVLFFILIAVFFVNLLRGRPRKADGVLDYPESRS